jgi:phosphopantetheine--protein transferase-like protein
MTTLETIRDCLKFRTAGASETVRPEPCTPIPIAIDQQHIWTARYSDLDRHFPVLSGLISAQEATRAAGFKKSRDARNFILRQGMVRAVLGQYILKEAQAVRFFREESGKPDLDPEENIHEIHFSPSHTDEMVCLGISRKNRIGIDIVKCDSRYPFSATAEYLFTPGERQWITRAPSHEQQGRFFRIWSLKEALLKTMGGGVVMMQETEVSGIMENRFLNGYYPVPVGKKEMVVFIHESGCDSGHHCTLVTIPAPKAGSQN